MTSISGSTVHFHSSFFEDKVRIKLHNTFSSILLWKSLQKIPPLGNTSFNVVFLGREEGFVESSLFIHTTEGHFKYNVLICEYYICRFSKIKISGERFKHLQSIQIKTHCRY
jgi:hypothetical protein